MKLTAKRIAELKAREQEALGEYGPPNRQLFAKEFLELISEIEALWKMRERVESLCGNWYARPLGNDKLRECIDEVRAAIAETEK